jgi:hypothetical protein
MHEQTTLFRKDRQKGRDGGVLRDFRPHLQPKQVFEIPCVEIIWPTINNTLKKQRVSAIGFFCVKCYWTNDISDRICRI